MDMPTTMSKFLAMGMPLKDVVLASTFTPAQMIQHAELGHLTVGAVADIAVWRLADGDFGFADAGNGVIHGKQRLTCEMTLRAGAVAWDWNARAGVDYKALGPTYGVRPGVDQIIKPGK
jgi:dihydroorotase